MQRLEDVTLGEIGRSVGRYRPFVATIVAISLVLFLAPDPSTDDGETIDSGADFGSTDAFPDASSPGGTRPTATSDAPSDADAAAGTPTPESSSGANQAGPAPTTGSAPEAMGPDCDSGTGRVRMPTLYAPPCVPTSSGDNGGATSRGVSGDTIVVVLYHCENPAQSAVFASQGADDSVDAIEQNFRDWLEMWSAHLETYGRTVKLSVMACSAGNTTDDAAGRADAVKVATEVKAFAVLAARGMASMSSAFVTEAAARQVLVIGAGGLGDDFYTKHAPYVWGAGGPGLHQLYAQVAEYVGKRLWGHNARWAGDPVLQQQKRKLGLIYTDTPDGANKSARDFFVQELGRHGASLAESVGQIYDLARGQEYARNIVARFKAKGVTSIIAAGNYLMLIFITQEATRQGYFPEWITAGGAALGTRTVGRLQDPLQWRNAFGPSGYWVRGPKEQYDPHFLYSWHFGRAPGAKGFEVFFHYPRILMFGIHLAGADLKVETFRDGLFRYPMSGGGVITPRISWGRQGLYDWDDFAPEDDLGHSWWDPDATGTDEFGREGRGVYRWMEGGRRYTRGEWPDSEPTMFNTEGTVTEYETIPPEEQPPSYEHEPHDD